MKNNPWDNIKKPSTDISINAILADTKNKLEFYWAKDTYDNLIFMLQTKQKTIIEHNIPKINGINISLRTINKDNQLILTLINNSDKDMFYTLCVDLLQSTKDLMDEILTVKTILKRLEKWQYFLKNNKSIIDKKQLQGLIGELYLIKKHLLQNFNVADTLNFWKAPLQSVQDFEIDNMAVEVKTKSSVNSITISSYEQLFTELDNLYLYVITINESSKNKENSFNVFDLIEEIRKLIRDENLLLVDNFNSLLLQYGFIELSEYEDLYFKIIADEFYLVEESFPRVLDVPVGVEKLTYKINLDSCKEFLINKNIFKSLGVDND